MGLPASNTERWFLHYSVEGIEHTMMLRSSEGTSEANASAAFHGLLSALSDLLASVTIVGMEKSEAGSDVRNPAVWGGDAGYGTGTQPDAFHPVELTFPGRTTGGHKARVSVFGYKEPIDDSFRLTTLESTPITNAVIALDSFSGRWLGIDGLAPIWHPYANIGFNDHWIREGRSSGA